MPVYKTTKSSGKGTNRTTTKGYFATKDKGTVNDIYAYTKDFKDVTDFNLMRGVPDFGNLMQFTPYESGYAVFIVCAIPKFMDMLATYNANYAKLIDNWRHIIEYEFKSFSGLSGITADTMEVGDDLNKINMINKVNMESTSEFSLTYDEKSGAPLTKFNKLYLTGLKDPRTQVKTYHGLIHHGVMEPGFENEVFTFLFINTDNTMRNVEFSALLIAGQINDADISIFGEYTKNDIDKKEVTVKFNAYPIISSKIDNYAQQCLNYIVGDGEGKATDSNDRVIGITVNSMEYDYSKSAKAIEDVFNKDWAAATNKGGASYYSNSSQTSTYNELSSDTKATMPGQSAHIASFIETTGTPQA